MKILFCAIAFCLIEITSFAADNTVTNGFADVQEERLYQRFVKKMQEQMLEMQKQYPSNADMPFLTNFDAESFRVVFKSMVVDPSFGFEWDEVPAPTLVGSNAMSAVNAFVATNGWNMQTNDCIFDCISDNDIRQNPSRFKGCLGRLYKRRNSLRLHTAGFCMFSLEVSITMEEAWRIIQIRIALQLQLIFLNPSANIGMYGHLSTSFHQQTLSRRSMKDQNRRNL